MTIVVTFDDGTVVTLHGRAAIDFIGQIQRGEWRLLEDSEAGEDSP